MNRAFTQREKVLLLVLAVLIIVIGYVQADPAANQ